MKPSPETLEHSHETLPEVIHTREVTDLTQESIRDIGATAITAETNGIELAPPKEPTPESIAVDIFSTYVRTYKIHARSNGNRNNPQAEEAYFTAQAQLRDLVIEHDGQTKHLISQATLAHLQTYPKDQSYVTYVSRALMDQVEALELQAQYVGADLLTESENASPYDD